MMAIDPNRAAALVATIHSPWRATVAECLSRWATLDADARLNSYLVVDGDEPGVRRTLNGRHIAALAAQLPDVNRACAA